MDKKKLIIFIVVIGLVFLTFVTWLHWYGIQEGQATLHAYPVTLYPNGSGTSSMGEFIDKTRIENATHLTDADFTAYPAIPEVLTGERSAFRGFSKMGGVAPGDEWVFAKKYLVSEYDGNYYVMLVMLS
jgi:hypothetical protein